MLNRDQKLRIRVLAGCQPIHHREGEESKPITYTVGYLTDEQVQELGVDARELERIPGYDGMESIMTEDGEHVARRVHTFDIPKMEADLDTTKALASKFVATNRQLYSLGR